MRTHADVIWTKILLAIGSITAVPATQINWVGIDIRMGVLVKGITLISFTLIIIINYDKAIEVIKTKWNKAKAKWKKKS